jgi:hypothetical protein
VDLEADIEAVIDRDRQISMIRGRRTVEAGIYRGRQSSRIRDRHRSRHRPRQAHSLTSCSAHFISIEGSSVRLGYSRNIPHSVLLVLVLGISCGFTTA